jgi:hypothetical protein
MIAHVNRHHLKIRPFACPHKGCAKTFHGIYFLNSESDSQMILQLVVQVVVDSCSTMNFCVLMNSSDEYNLSM